MKKAFDQTVRDIKRGVNKNVLKVPRIERKVLDATSNESWGPHGSLLAEIAQASHNHYEYQMIMAIIWKRLSDRGKNWRHVYKGLTVLEYLVANGSERVIGEIRARAYQISTLSGFRYFDSKGRDQGINVRRKALSLSAIVNDEEKINEIREKASSNTDRYNNSSTGKPDSYSGYDGGGSADRYDDHNEDHFQRRDDNNLGNGREDHDGCNDVDNLRDDDYRGHNKADGNRYGPQNNSADVKGDNTFKEDDRDREGKLIFSYHDERSLEHKFSDQHVRQPPSYEEAVKNADNSISDQGIDGTSAMPIHSNATPPASSSAPSKTPMLFIHQEIGAFDVKEIDTFDDFDPRGPIPAVPTVASVELDLFGSAAPSVANNIEMDIFGSLSIEDSTNSLALVPVTSVSTTSEWSAPTNSVLPSVFNQPNTNPFEDAPFHAVSQENVLLSLNNTNPSSSFEHNFESISYSTPQPTVFGTVVASSGHDFGELFHSVPSNTSISNGQPASADIDFQMPGVQASYDILEGILPTNGPSSTFPSRHAVVDSSTMTETHRTGFLALPAVSTPVASQEDLPNPYGQPEKLSQGSSENNLNSSALTNEPLSTMPLHAGPSVAPTWTQTDPSESLAQPALSMPALSQGISPSPCGEPEMLPQVNSHNNLNSSGLISESLSTFPSQTPLSIAPTTTQTDHSDFLAQPATLPVASQKILPNPYGQSQMLPQVVSQNNPNLKGVINEPSSALAAQTGPSIVQTRMQTDHPVLPPLSAVSVSSHSQASLPRSSSLPEISSTHVVSHNTNGASIALTTQDTLTIPPIMTQTGHSDFLVQSTASVASASKAVLPNYHGQQGLSPQDGSVQHLNSKTLSSKVASTGGLPSITSSPSFDPPGSSQAAPSNTSGQTVETSQPSEKFEAKSTVWADTISRGLVNLNISGPKVNPLASIGVDFDSLNRKEKREKEKSSAPPVSAITMGKAMGSGSGMGRAAATGLAAPNPMMGSGMGWGPGGGITVGGFGGVNVGMGTGMSMNMAMGQGVAMQPNAGAVANPAGVGVPGTGYNPLMSMNRYGSVPYGGAYR